jgi:hypothetical protein
MGFTTFTDWKSAKTSIEETTSTEQASPKNAEILSQIAELSGKRKEFVRNKKDLNVQILDVEIAILKLDLEKNQLMAKKADLEQAKALSLQTSKEGINNG